MSRRLSSAVKAARRANEDEGLNALAETLAKRIMGGVTSVIGREIAALPKDRASDILDAVAKSDGAVSELMAAIQKIELPDPDLSPILEEIRKITVPPVPEKWEFKHTRISRGNWETHVEAVG